MFLKTYLLRLDVEIFKDVKRIAKEMDRSMAYILKMAITDFIRRHDNDK